MFLYIHIFVVIPVNVFIHAVYVSIFNVSGTTFGNWLIYFGFVGCHSCNHGISPVRMFPRNPTFWERILIFWRVPTMEIFHLEHWHVWTNFIHQLKRDIKLTSKKHLKPPMTSWLQDFFIFSKGCNQLIALVTGLDLPGFPQQKWHLAETLLGLGSREFLRTNKPPGRRDLDLWWNWTRLGPRNHTFGGPRIQFC